MAEVEQLIQHESYSEEWKSSQEDAQGRFWQTLPSLIGCIERVAHVRLQQSLTTAGLTVLGDSKAAVDGAMQKLKNLEEAMAYHMIVYHHLILEAEHIPQLRFLGMKEVLDSRLRTTLVSSQSAHYKSLRRSFILVLIKNGEIGGVDPSGEIENSTHLWSGHPLTFQSIGDVPQTTVAVTPISRWVDESNAAQVVDPFAPSKECEPTFVDSPKITDPKPISQEMASTKRVRKVKGAVGKVVDLPVLNEVDELKSSELHSTAASQSLLVDDSGLGDTPLVVEQDHVQPTARTRTAAVSELHPPVIQPPFLPPPSMENARTWEREHHNWEQSVAQTSTRVGRLIQLDSPAPGSQEGRISEDKMHRTMGQKKGQSVTNHAQGVKLYEDQVHEMMNSTLAFSDVKISVPIGRILVNRHSVHEDYRTRAKPFGVADWPRVTSHLQMEFTERLTTKSSDASHIIELKLPGGRRLFEEKPLQRSVTYVIQCLTKSSEHIIIELFEDGVYAVRSDRVAKGALYWHFPKRAWDACLQVTSQEFLCGQYAKEVCCNPLKRTLVTSADTLRLEADTFVKNIEVTQGTAGLSMSLSSKGSNFQVQSVTLRREIVHTAVTVPDLQLNIIEVQALSVGQSTANTELFVATLTPADQMIADQRLWWEASITSQHASKVLRESETLEIGEKATWIPEAILNCGVVEDMHELVKDIVFRIDQVGIGNKGPATAGSKQTTKPSEKSHDVVPFELPTGAPGYW